MSAATSQPLVGQSKSAAPFGAVALIAGVLTIGAIGIALGQNAKATPAAGAVPADVQQALLVQRMGEKASLFPAGDARLIQHQGELADRLGAYGTSDPRLVQHLGEMQDRIAGTLVYGSIRTPDGLIFGRAPIVYGSIRTPDGLVFGRPVPVAPIVRTLPDGRIVDLHSSMTGSAGAAGTYVTSDGRVIGRPRAIPVKPSVYVLPNGRIIPMRPSHVGPQTAAQKGLVAAVTVNPFAGKAADDAALSVNRVTYSGKTRDALSGTVAPNRWTILATNPYSQGLLSGGATVSAAFATGGMRYDHR